jgi:hypothetical protein
MIFKIDDFLEMIVKAGLRIYLEPPLLHLQPVLHPTDGVLGSLINEAANL